MEANDIKEYKDLAEAFVSLGFTPEYIEAIHSITAAALYCGELEPDFTTFDDRVRPATPVSFKNTAILQHIAKLLGVKDYKDLVDELVMKEKNPDPNVKERIPDTPIVVGNNIVSLSKGLFDNMFNWLVIAMNQEILPEALKSPDPSVVE